MKQKQDAHSLFLKSLQDVAKSNSDTYEYFQNAYHYIRMVAEKYSNSLILKSTGGLGKTYIALKTLQELKIPFVYLNSYSTPLSFYEFLYNNKDKLIVLDDCENVLQDKVSVSILKSALWSPTNKRIVHYLSTSDKMKVPPNFIFTGRIIFCVNQNLIKNAAVRALQTRVLFYEMKFTYKDIIRIMFEIAKDPYKDTTHENRLEVTKYLQKVTDEATIDLNFRTLIKSFDIYIYAKKYTLNWKQLIDGIVTKNNLLSVIKQLLSQELSTPEQIYRFKLITGKSRATYYRLLSRLKIS